VLRKISGLERDKVGKGSILHSTEQLYDLYRLPNILRKEIKNVAVTWHGPIVCIAKIRNTDLWGKFLESSQPLVRQRRS
jgi:hypothetical protein